MGKHLQNAIGDASLVRARAIVPGVRADVLRNRVFWDHWSQNLV